MDGEPPQGPLAEEVSSQADLWRQIELSGDVPHQATFTQFVMLPKNELVERPIGLMSTFLKLGIKGRQGLITQWLQDFGVEWWDSALPKRSTLRRAFHYKVCRVDSVHRCSVFFDLSTFYEGVAPDKLYAAAKQAGFPALPLHLAMEAYRGGRIITSDEVSSPTVYASKGILAGCPLPFETGSGWPSPFLLYRPVRGLCRDLGRRHFYRH